MKFDMRVGLGPGHILLDGDPAPLPQKGHSPRFSTHVPCNQTAEWIKMPLGMEVGLGPGDFMLDGDPAPPRKKGTASNFRPMSIVAKRLDGSRCHLVRKASPRRHSVGWGPVPPKKGHSPQLLGHVYCGQTVAHLSYC